MYGNLGGVAIAAVIATGCAPSVDGPVERQRAIDREDADRLAAQLAALPGAVAAYVVLHHPARDPLAPAARDPCVPGIPGVPGVPGSPGAATGPGPATFSAVITVDDRAEPATIRAAATRLARATLPELAAGAALAIEINPAVHRPALAKVGPFSVEDSSRAPLRATLAIACLAIAGLAGALALGARRHRLGNSAQ